MAQSSLEQLQRLSDKIYDEELSFAMEQMVKAYLNAENGTTEEKDSRRETEHEKCASLLLRSMRIHLCLDLIKQGHSSCIEDFKKDWDEIIDCLQFMECTWKVTNELLCDAVDIILLLDPSKRNDLLRLLDFSTRLKIKKQKPLRFPVVDCAFQMADYCLQTSRADELFLIIANLISLSEKRNSGDLNKHRSIISWALRYIVDNDHSLTLKICEAQKKYYEGVVNSSACNFYWYYAFTLLNLNRAEEGFALSKYCYDLCMKAEGETSWIGARSGIAMYGHQLLTGDKEEAERYLWDALKKIDSGFYHNMDQHADYVAASTRAALLRFRQDQQALRGLLPEIERLRDYCVSVEETNLDPNLTVRHAENKLAAYYLEAGDHLLAADHSLRALNSIPPNGLPAEPSDILIYTNLLAIYTELNDIERVDDCIAKINELADDYADDEFVMSRANLLISTAYHKFLHNETDLEDDRKALRSFYRSIRHSEVEPYASDIENSTFALEIMDICSHVLDSYTAKRDELLRIRTIVTYFQDRPGVYKFTNAQKCVCKLLRTQVEWQLGSPSTLAYLDECLRYVDSVSASREVSISILRFAAVVYYNYQRTDLAVTVINRVLSGITAAWQKAAAYLNDQRICQQLLFIQIHFGICCAILRASVSPYELYERILQFKNLPALVGRERNRLLRLAPVDECLKEQIFAKQNQLADAELNDSLNGTDTARAVSEELEHLETLFAAQFPQNLEFTQITYDRICDKLPNESAIIEYFFISNETALHGGPHDSDALELDVFVTTKINGAAQLHYLQIKRGDVILNQAQRFIYCLQEPEDYSAVREKELLRSELYHKLIEPVLPYLGSIKNLYLAPDDQLCNLPFEILYADGSGLLQDRYKVCRLVCGRDLLFSDDHNPTGGGSFILGDPNYESERGEISNSHTRGGQASLEPVEALPFSGIEAARIARRIRSHAYTGDAATKYALQNALPCKIIHLATHGVFDDNLETDSLYTSHLVFAGYNKWVTNKTESSYCGNGVLTADEISRMDLHQTELVVLSACQSGLGDTSYRSVRGLLSAFSAAGARWVISHLWKANDFSTPILMDAFYDAWLNRGKEIPDALQYAKNYLRTVTISTLRRDGWFSLPYDARISEDILMEIHDMNSWPGDIKPFEDEYYWGGFTVHKTK